MKTTAETVKEGAKLLQQGLDLLRGGPLTFYLDDLTGAVDYLMDRFCPVKEGDRVELIEAPEISATVSWGLLPYKHFLVAGAHGVVKSVECGRKGIRVYVEFDDQSWLDRQGREQPLDKPRQFCFADAELRTLTAGVALPATGWKADKLGSSLAWPADTSTDADGVGVAPHQTFSHQTPMHSDKDEPR